MNDPGQPLEKREQREVAAPDFLSMEPFASAPDDWFVFDLTGRIVDVNPSALARLGYSREELIGKCAWEISTRQTEAGFLRLVADMRAEGPQSLFGHNQRKDGSFYSVEVRLWISDFAGSDYVFAALRDSAGHQELLEERDQLISLIENSAEAITVASTDGVISYMNPAGCELLGHRRLEDVAGRRLAELFDADQAQLIDSAILPAVRRGQWQGELTYRNEATGQETPCWVYAFAIKHSQRDEMLGLALMGHDVSQRKQAERHRQRLLELNEVSRNVATSLLENDDLSQAIEIILSGAGTILGVNRAYLCRYRQDRSWVFRTHQWRASQRGGDAASGSSRGETLSVPPRSESSDPYAWMTEMLAKGEPIKISDAASSGLVPREGSGVLRPDVKALLVIPVIIHGKLESFFGFTDTETTREWEDEELAILQIIVDSFARAIERRIAERQRAEIAHDLEESVARERSANRYKSEFLANMSHELRTPMNAIVGYAELLSRTNADREKQDLWAANIKRSTAYLLSLVNDVLDLSKIEAGQMAISTETASLHDIVTTVYELLRGQASEKLIDLEVQFDGPLPEEIETDPVRLRQILVNLVGNAIKFTNKGGVKIHIHAKEYAARAGGESPGPIALYFSIIDTGIGIGTEDLERLFNPFSQVHSSDNAASSGTGLGLVIARQLAELLGGEISVLSEVGKGSTFTLTLTMEVGRTVAQPPQAPAAPPPSPRTADFLSGFRILIVDDSAENRDVLTFLLSDSGCDVETAKNGEEGVQRVAEAEQHGLGFDLVLMDMNMPVLDGHAATKQLVKSGFQKPIIALTALALAGDELRCREAGCVDYVAKPIQPTRFFDTLNNHLNPSRTESADEKPGMVVSDADDGGLSLVGNPRFQPLLDRYVGSFSTLCEELAELRAEGELVKLRTQVHRLRGTAANYGFPEISRAAGECEDLIRAEADPDSVDVSLQSLIARLREESRPAGESR